MSLPTNAMSPAFVLLDNSRADRHAEDAAQLFADAVDVFCCQDYDDVAATLARMEAALDAGYHLAGYFSYELGYAFEDRLRQIAPPRDETPLLWFGAFRTVQTLSASDVTTWLDPVLHPAADEAAISDLQSLLSESDYNTALSRIQDYLLSGDIYQVNFTFPLDLEFTGKPRDLYRRLRRSQPVDYAAWINDGQRHILSLSPELFIRKKGDTITTRPMKGTARRGLTRALDDQNARILAEDPKQQAENIMIVDLLRNDLSRMAEPGSVSTTSLFEVERYRSLLQMTSTVTARPRRDLRLQDILRSLYPCGSITGAPKIRAMEIIRDLETFPRGVYTGSIGHISPDRDFTFNVAIRTLTLEPKGTNRWHGRLGIGSGIVADSKAKSEYAECLLKARFLTHPMPEFDLIETLGWVPGEGYRHLEDHLARLGNSAVFFDIPLDGPALRENLAVFAADLEPVPQRIRILLGPSGATSIMASPLPPAPDQVTVRLSDLEVDPQDLLLYHKTSHRALYRTALRRAQTHGPCFDVILKNRHGEVTEGSFTNIFVERNGKLLTPPLQAGLLPGILRQRLLESGQAEEATILPEDLRRADRIYIGNSLRGLVPATLAD